MKIKKKSIITGVFSVLLFGLLIVGLVFLAPKSDNTYTAQASTTPSYTVIMNGTYARANQSNGYSKEIIDAEEFDVNTGLSANTRPARLYLSGSYTNGSTGILYNKDYINFSDVHFTSSQSDFTLTIYDEYSASVASGTGSVSASLSDGLYKIVMSYYAKSGSGTMQFQVSFSVYCYFTVDATGPSISGASTSQTGTYTNQPFTVSASDSASGVGNLFMRSPSESVFRSVGSTSKTVSRGNANGRYTFYATDKAGNSSQYYYVNFDDTAPSVSCTGASFGTNTNDRFTVSASDNSGSAKLYYKKGNAAWNTSGSSYTVSETAAEGIYYFYAADDYGNSTSEMWVQVGAELSGKFVKSDTDNSVFFTWERPSWTATLDGEPYTKGTWITDEGEHTIKLSSNSKSAVYPYTIDHCFVRSVEKPTCTHEGYLQYNCLQCGYSYTDYSIEETGHYYVASTTVATCTDGGYTLYTCTRCGDSYTDNYTNSLGHNYESAYRPANCTDYGKTVYTCQVCGSSYYETDGTLPTGHSYTNEIVTAPTCTDDGLRRSTCEICGDVFDTPITANGHNYNITDSASENGQTVRTYTCTVCGHSYAQDLGDQYAEVTNYVEYLFEQYEPYMWWVLLASAGVWSIVIGVMIAISHKNEDKEKAKKMLINYVIGLVAIAVIVVACPFLIRGIASLIT